MGSLERKRWQRVMGEVFEGRFAGQSAIVVGGAMGIGAGVADRLAAEGAEVTVWDIKTSHDHPSRTVDVTDWTQVEAAAADIRTPLLLIHGEGDLRCPIEQAEQLFAALTSLEREVKFVRYGPSAGHGLPRRGPPDLRLHRLTQIADWLDQHLKPKIGE